MIAMDLGSSIDSSSAMNDPSSPSKKPKHTQDALAVVLENQSIVDGHVDQADPNKSYSLGLNGPDNDDNDDDNADEDDDDDDDDDDYYAYDDYDDDGNENMSDNNGYETMQSQFDNVDLPPGVEASFPLLTCPSANQAITATKTLTISDLPGISAKESFGNQTALAESSASSSKALADPSSSCEVEGSREVNAMSSSRFDVVASFSDHHYATSGFKEVQPPKNWAKKIQEEWKILTTDLPETIFVRVCEARMELLRAVIVGPQGTPYHDGLFVFDCLFPIDYPNSPPSVYYYSGGLRLNPNLYDCGKVCLSLLGTWDGNKNERWIPEKSTMLQVLVSIQALILNEKPFFNEPGYERFTGAVGEFKSRRYNEDVFIFSLKTMIYTLRRPPQHFEGLVAQHFRDRAHSILSACKAYVEGVLVGCDIEGPRVQNEFEEVGIKEFKSKVASLMKLLYGSFTRNGSSDCEEFRVTVP